MVTAETAEPLALVVVLTVPLARLEQFRSFEQQAARIMLAYGGRIEQSVVVPLPADPQHLKEVHVVTFPSSDAFEAYRADSELAALAPLRESAIAATEIWMGRQGPTYMAEAGARATLRE
ncbi:MAG TPA: hypothetical protein VK524_01470 [Polyangiaceae bacterium]|nr:hypothetical protein [Polyangiaceae bacterium]